MLTVYILQQNPKYLFKTLESLERQHRKDFNIVVANPGFNNVPREYRSIYTPKGLNNQLNTLLRYTSTENCGVTLSGSIPNYHWVDIFFLHETLDYISGPVNLTSQNEKPEWLKRPESVKYFDCYNGETANHCNFFFKRSKFNIHGGFNSNEDTLKYYINQFQGNYIYYQYVDYLVDFDTNVRKNYYRINFDNTKAVKWKKTNEKQYPKTKDNLLVSIAIGSYYKEVLSYVEESHFAYAEKINADVIQITNETQEWWGLEKFRLKELCKDYHRVLLLDSDVFIKDNAPNIFEKVPDGYIGIYNDWSENGDGTNETNYWIKDEAKEMCEYQGVDYIDSEAYNSGIIVFNGNQSNIFDPPLKPFVPTHCSEQHWVEQNIRRYKYPVYFLSKLWNNQAWTQKFEKYLSECYFVHYSGLDRVSRIQRMFQEFNKGFCKIQDGHSCKLNKVKLPVTKHKNNCIVTVAVNGYEDILAETSKSYQQYADKIGADFHIISENIHEDWPMGNKFLIENYTQVYDKTLYIDCDVWIKENSPNIFKETPDDKISLVNETEIIKKTEYFQHVGWQFKKICDIMGVNTTERQDSYNCGVMVIPQSKSYLYTTPEFEFPGFWCFDQHYLLANIVKYKEEIFELSSWFNWEYIHEEWEKYLDKAFFVHLNGIKSKRKRLHLIDRLQ